MDRTAYIRRGEVSAPEARYVVGVDAGGTKTHAAVATLDGQVVSLVEAGPGNFQAVGVQAATQNTKKAVDGALSAAGITPDDLAWSAFAVAGADRHKDFITIADYLETIVPGHVLTNDTLAALWGSKPGRQRCGAYCGHRGKHHRRQRKGRRGQSRRIRSLQRRHGLWRRSGAAGPDPGMESP